MLTYCLVCRKNTKNNDSKIVKTKNDRLMSSSKCTICDIKSQNLLKSNKLKDYEVI